jgi:hypothetical protein
MNRLPFAAGFFKPLLVSSPASNILNESKLKNRLPFAAGFLFTFTQQKKSC